MVPQKLDEDASALRSSDTMPTQAEQNAALESLRAQFDELQKTFGEAVASSAQMSTAAAQDAIAYVRDEIRRAPLVALGLAAVAGALVAVVLSETRQTQPTPLTIGKRLRSALPVIDIDALRSSVDHVSTATRDRMAGLVPAVEQLAQALSHMEATTMAPLLERGVSMARGLWELLGNNRGRTL